MAAPSCSRSLVRSFKRLKLSPCTPVIQCQTRHIQHSAPRSAQPTSSSSRPADIEQELANLRLPKAVQATYLNPLKRPLTHGIRVCELQLRSYSVRNVELFADFALRAAYFLNLPATGPNPLKQITERWTVPRSNFVHKKSQENFERKTLRRGICVYDGHPETVAIWLAFLKKYQYYGVGMKAHVFEHGGLDVAEDMDREAKAIGEKLGEQFEHFGGRSKLMLKDDDYMQNRLLHEPFKAAWGAAAASGGAQSVLNAKSRIERIKVGGKKDGSESR